MICIYFQSKNNYVLGFSIYHKNIYIYFCTTFTHFHQKHYIILHPDYLIHIHLIFCMKIRTLKYIHIINKIFTSKDMIINHSIRYRDRKTNKKNLKESH